MAYRINLGFERLTRLNPNFNYEKWYFQKTISPFEITNKPFFTDYSRPKEIIESFDIHQLIGTSHPSYYKMMWIEMLGRIERFEKYYEIKNYLERRDNIHLLKYGDEYIIGAGSNRLCITKFLDRPVKNIEVIDHEFNDKLYEKWSWFNDKNIKPIDYDNSYWRFDYNTNGRLIIKDNLIEDFIKSHEDFDPNISKPLFKQMLSSSQNILPEKVEITRTADLNSKTVKKFIHQQKKKW